MLVYKRKEELSGAEIDGNIFGVFQLIFFLTLGYIVCSWLFRLWKQYKQLKNDRTEAELTLLKSKVDPHFFFNTLNNLYGLAIEKSDKTPEVILKLSEIMRYTIYDAANDYVALKDEVDYLETYLEIHKIRYQKNVRINFSKSIANELMEIAPLMLIMLVENAIKHGVESMVDGAYIEMSLKTTPGSLVFHIKNNFKPMIRGEKGIGLTNLGKRLQLMYPSRHQLIIKKDESTFSATLKLRIQ